MHLDEADLRVDIEQALNEVVQQKGIRFSAKIRPIVLENLKNGRGNFFLQNIPNTTPRDYVLHVVETYEHLCPFIQGIQIERSSKVWEPLYEKLQKFSYNFLVKRGLYPGESTFHLAVDCAADAAIAIIQAQFPYDTDFDPWAYNFVKFSCLKRIEKEARRADRLKKVLYQDEAREQDVDPKHASGEWGLQVDVLNALPDLTENRQRVLQLRYECGLSSKEIAIRMEKSVSAVDKLHFDAIRQLRHLLNVDVT